MAQTTKLEKKSGVSREIEIPNGVQVSKDGRTIIVKGIKGELKRNFLQPKIKIDIQENKVILSSNEDRRKINSVLGAWQAHIKNMCLGASIGWKCEMKLVFAHFPAKMSIKDNEFVIQNFLGERSSRSTKLPSDVSVKVDKENLTISGVDKEQVGIAASRIEGVTRIVGFDKRVFQDGCFITQHPHLAEQIYGK